MRSKKKVNIAGDVGQVVVGTVIHCHVAASGCRRCAGLPRRRRSRHAWLALFRRWRKAGGLREVAAAMAP